jgi:enoyl-CoA hydratase
MALADVKDSITMINIEVEENGTAILTLNRPKVNALNTELLGEVKTVFQAMADDETVKGVILTAPGEKFFVAGADINGFLALDGMGGRAAAKFAQGCFQAIEDLEKPVIAAVNGYALGGGNEIAMACDIRIASTNAIFGQPEVNLGIMPCFGGTQRLSRLVGAGIAKELMFTARNVKADEALKIGLVNKVVEPAELVPAAKEMMATILTKAPLGVAACKVAINKGMDLSIADGLNLEADLNGLLFSTSDKNEGVGAFIEKREAKFTAK